MIMNSNSIFEVLERARELLQLKTLMSQRGKAPADGKWRSFPDCPYCHKKGKAGVREHKGREWFKCFNSACPSGTAPRHGAWDEIGFLAYECGLKREEAAVVYLKEAGLWQEERLAPSVLPGQRARRKKSPVPETPLPAPMPASLDANEGPAPASLSSLQKSVSDDSNRKSSELEVGGPAAPDASPAATPSVTPVPAAAPTAEPGDTLSAAPVVDTPTSAPAASAAEAAASESFLAGPLGALRWFYARLPWRPEDEARLWRERGLTPQVCRWLGYRSNRQTNLALLQELAKHFPVAVLVESGLWLEANKATEPAYPNPQFYGMSIREKRDAQGKKVRDEEGEAVKETVWNEPILIPYFDREGQLIHLRPHKGMMRGKTPRFYVVRVAAEHRREFANRPLLQTSAGATAWALVSEGEFKVAAAWQVFNGEIEAGALPGITMAKPLFGDVEEWLEVTGVRQVVVGYDREDKSDPALPGYQAEELKRYDAEVWARYLARQLGKLAYEAKVCVLPAEWMVAGKADWDGRLAARVAELLAREAQLLLQPDLCWAKVCEPVRQEFAAVIARAVPVHELWQAGFFDTEAERIIKNRLEWISYQPKLPVGGDDELVIARRLRRMLPRLREELPKKMVAWLLACASAYQDLKGGYYTFKALREDKVEQWREQLERARERNQQDVVRVCEVALKGMPQRISDFYIKPHYVLNRLNGTRERLVTLHNLHGVHSRLLALPSAAFAQPSKFREWLLNSITGATWSAGERELNALQEDIGRRVAFKDVAEVPLRGYHAESKCWFMGDCTYLPDGRVQLADKSSIVWVKAPDGSLAQAYKLSATDHEGQTFRHGEPQLHPKVKKTDEEVRQMFQEVAEKLRETIGNYGGYLVLGSVLAYGAATEIYREFAGVPGLWLHGEKGQGKSSVARWMMRLWGLNVDIGLPLLDSTKVGLSIALQQYSSLPVWFEEYQPASPQWLTEKLKNIFDRGSGSKKTFEEGDRKILAGAIVTGVATSLDAQLKSRYAHVQVAAANRTANHYEWFQKECEHFYVLGRYLLQRREEFAKRVVEQMRKWLREEMAGTDPRSRVVHSAAYGAMHALASLLGADLGLLEFRQFLIGHCQETTQETTEAVNVNQYWYHVINAVKVISVGRNGDEFFGLIRFVEDKTAVCPLTTAQRDFMAQHPEYGHTSLLCYFQPGPIIERIRENLHKQGRELPLDKADLRHQMKTRPYWVKSGRKDGYHCQRFVRGAPHGELCWCISIDKHELGFQPTSDEDFFKSLYASPEDQKNGKLIPPNEWIDPRKGPLYAIVNALTERKSES